MPNHSVRGSLGNGASSERMSQFIEALIRVDLSKQKAIQSDRGVNNRMGIFGWCLTGHHELCYKKIPFQVCTCTCHSKEDENEQLGTA